jgi:hypothetical protein
MTTSSRTSNLRALPLRMLVLVVFSILILPL